MLDVLWRSERDTQLRPDRAGSGGLEEHTFGAALAVENGRIAAPQGPGLEVDPDLDIIRAYRTT